MIRIIATVTLVAATAAADPRDAQRAFAAGRAAYELGDFATAVEAFDRAYAIDPDPETAFSFAQALRRAYYVDLDPALLERARGLYEAYLRARPAGVRARHSRQHLATIERLLARLAPKQPDAAPETQLLILSEVAEAHARVDGGAEVIVPAIVRTTPGAHHVRIEASGHDPAELEVIALDGKQVVATAAPLPRPGRLRIRAPGSATVSLDGVRLDGDETSVVAGRHQLLVRRTGFVPQLREIFVPLDGAVTVDVSLSPTARRRTARALLWTSAGLGTATAVAGIAAYRAQSAALDARPASGPTDPAAYNSAVDRRDAWRDVAIAGGIAALAAGGVGAYLMLADDQVLESHPPEPRLVPLIGPDALGLAGSF
jgi:tetratricopeptide (TPR) repeat protein